MHSIINLTMNDQIIEFENINPLQYDSNFKWPWKRTIENIVRKG